jgi:hypothetical protein
MNIDLIAKVIVRDALREMGVTGSAQVAPVAEQIVTALREAGLLVPEPKPPTAFGHPPGARGLADEEPWVDVDTGGKRLSPGPPVPGR